MKSSIEKSEQTRKVVEKEVNRSLSFRVLSFYYQQHPYSVLLGLMSLKYSDFTFTLSEKRLKAFYTKIQSLRLIS